MAENPNKVVAQKGALVGDEAVQEAAHTVEPQVAETEVDAQVMVERDPEAAKVSVQETFVAMDKPVLDPSAPEAVQIPDAGRGSLDLPIHKLQGESVEDVFAREASKPSKS